MSKKNEQGKEKLTIYEKAFKDIIELTFKYKKIGNNFFNITLFFDFLGIDKGEYKNKNYLELQDFLKSKEIEKNLKKKLLDKIKSIENKKKELNKKDELYYFLSKAYDYNINILRIILLGLPFEFEKAGIKNSLTEEEKKEILKEQNILEEKNGMFSLHKNKEYSRLAYKFLVNKIGEKKDNLSKKDLEGFSKFLNIIKANCGENFEYYSSGKKDIQTITKKFVSDKLKNIKIPREDVIKLFNFALKLNGINKKVIEDEVDFIYDGPDALYYPKNKKFDYLKAHRVFALIDHEIEKHFLNEKIHKYILGGIERGHGNLEKEEGLAIIGEKILLGEKIDNIGIISTFVQTYIGELVSGKKLKEFIGLISKIIEIKDVNNRFYRLKRTKDINLPGVQKKDSLYSLGLLKILDYIKKGGDIRKLFLGKISFNDIDYIYNLKKDKIEFGNILPTGVSEILMFKFLQRFYGKEKIPNFNTYIREKYGNLNQDFFRKLNKEHLKIIVKMDEVLKEHIKN